MSNCTCPIGRVGSCTQLQEKWQEPDLFAAQRVPKLHTKPVNRCPVCSKAVFFCALPNQGRVYFDELRPRWRKHDCTDSSSSFNVGAFETGEHAWAQVEELVVSSVAASVLRLSGLLRSKRFVTFIPTNSLSDYVDPAPHLRESFLQARMRFNGGADLVLVTLELRPEILTGFATAERAKKSAPGNKLVAHSALVSHPRRSRGQC